MQAQLALFFVGVITLADAGVPGVLVVVEGRSPSITARVPGVVAAAVVVAALVGAGRGACVGVALLLQLAGEVGEPALDATGGRLGAGVGGRGGGAEEGNVGEKWGRWEA